MKLGIMQPYLFPYIGYFQLINSVDKFVVYDDVSYIKQGWINRNRILLNCQPYAFSVPIKNASSFQNINDTAINYSLYPVWQSKFLKTLVQAYAKAPNYSDVYQLVRNVLEGQYANISEMAVESILQIGNYIGLDKEIVRSSTIYGNSDLRSAERVIDICKREAAATYINPIGGQELYSKDVFVKENLDLYFIKSKLMQYKQFDCEFAPWLSIIDLLMFVPKEEIVVYLNAYELV